MTRMSWVDKKHLIVGGIDSALVIVGDPGPFSGSFVMEDYSHVLSSIWEVPFESVYRDGSTFSTICDSAGTPNHAANLQVVFTAPFGETGLWPAHRLNVLELTNTDPAISA